MRSILRTAAMMAVSLSTMSFAFDPKTNTGGQDPHDPRAGLSLPAFPEQGCYAAPGRDMIDMGVYQYQSTGWCQPLCWRQSYKYMALVNGTNCFCGNTMPAASYKISSDKCNGTEATICSGFGDAKCGGQNAWDIYDDGWTIGQVTGSVKITVPSQTYTFPAYASSTSSSSSSSVQATLIITESSSATASAEPSASSGSSGNKTAVIAAVVVVVVVLVIGIIGGVFFFMRRRKQKAIAEEQLRHEMLTNFVTAEKPGSGYTSPDSRLDPSLMFQRRMSDGSIRDNEDYSRRILKVANPDD